MKQQDTFIPLHSEDKEPISSDSTTFPSCTDGTIMFGKDEIVVTLFPVVEFGELIGKIKVTWE